MSRRKTTAAADVGDAEKQDAAQGRGPAEPHEIRPTAVYGVPAARRILGLGESTFRREKRLGRLKVGRRAGFDFVLGAWLLEWLEGGAGGVGAPRAGPAPAPHARADGNHAGSRPAAEAARPTIPDATPSLGPALSAARACAYCAWELSEAVRALGPDQPDADPAWTDVLRDGAADNLADLRDALADLHARLPGALPALAPVAANPPPAVALPPDAPVGLGARALADPTAHGLARRLAHHVLLRVWRATDPVGYREAATDPAGLEAALDAFDAKAAADRLSDGRAELAGALPTFDRAALDAALRGEATRAGLPASEAEEVFVRGPRGRFGLQDRAVLSWLADEHGGVTRTVAIGIAVESRYRDLVAEVGQAEFERMVRLGREDG